MILQVALYQPEIPPNTGNIIRLCANTGAQLHLIAPLGFVLDDSKLRRAGLDYREWVDVSVHASLAALRQAVPGRLLACSTRGNTAYHETKYQDGDTLLFGPETRGLPPEILELLPNDQRLYIPMRPGNRSLNLSNAVAVVVYEAWRQLNFSQAAVRAAEPSDR